MTITITHKQRCVVAHHELDLGRQARTMREVDEIFEGEDKRDVLVHFDDDVSIVFLALCIFLVIGIRSLGFLGGLGSCGLLDV
jgi:hypothetical protein